MHRNENKYDQLFRDRLQDLSHPVRNELWSRIHRSIRARIASVPNPHTKLQFLKSARYLPTLAQRLRLLSSAHRHPTLAQSSRFWYRPFPRTVSSSNGLFSNGLFSATSLTVAAAAALVITLGIIHFTHTATPTSAQPVNHYSKITPAIAPARSTGESSVTPRDSSRDRSNESVTPANPRTTLPLLRSTGNSAFSRTELPLLNSPVPSNGLSPAPAAPGIAGTTFTNPSATPQNTATAVIHRNHLTPGDRITTTRHHHTSGATESMPGTPGVEETAATSGIQTPKNQTMAELSVDRHNSNPLTLPAMARTSMRAAITADAPGSKSLHNGSNGSGNWPALPPFHRTGYVSLYASPDFPNHYYSWSYTLGGRLTFQFSRRWSFTAGFEYARVNVPTLTALGLQAFHFSNYEVPLLFGYTRASRHAALTVYGGAILNLYFHQSTSAWVNNWPDRDSYGAVLGLEYSYSLGRHLAIFAQPYARYSISDYRMFTQTQRWSFGTLLGIKYRL